MAIQSAHERLSRMDHLAHSPHIFLIGFRNRLSVFAAWVWNYLTFTRGARLITGDQRLPGWPAQPAAGANADAKQRQQVP